MVQLRLDGKKKIHVAIMRKSWGLIDKILAGEKRVESRWYKNRSKPWGEIMAGETIYFKDSGGPVKARAIVDKVLRFENVDCIKRQEILAEYGRQDLGLSENVPREIRNYFEDKKYCLLVFFSGVQKVKPFFIDKTGFGSQTAWLIVNDLDKIKRK